MEKGTYLPSCVVGLLILSLVRGFLAFGILELFNCGFNHDFGQLLCLGICCYQKLWLSFSVIRNHCQDFVLEQVIENTICRGHNHISFFKLNIVIVSVLGGILADIVFLLQNLFELRHLCELTFSS